MKTLQELENIRQRLFRAEHAHGDSVDAALLNPGGESLGRETENLNGRVGDSRSVTSRRDGDLNRVRNLGGQLMNGQRADQAHDRRWHARDRVRQRG